MQQFLDAGFTTVLSAITPDEGLELRRKIEEGEIKGPRIFAARLIPLARPAGGGMSRERVETQTSCSACGKETTVPFKPTQGRPVLCRQCFQTKRAPSAGALVTAAGAEHTAVSGELLVAQAPHA